MLEGAAAAKFDIFATEICDQHRKDEKGADIGKRGESEEAFGLTLRAFVRSYFKPVADSLHTQREYLNHGIKFPIHRGVELNEWLARLCTVNAKLEEFPTPAGYSGNKFFSEAEIKRVTLRAFPRPYQVQVSKSGRTLEEYTLTTLQEFLEACMVDGEKDAPERANRDKNKKNLMTPATAPRK